MARSDPGPRLLEDDFQFTLCEGCQQESPNLKLLTCLHTLCLSCLSKNKPIGHCPLCRTAIPQASGIPNMDNLLFTNLQAKLKIYKKITDGVDLFCNNCKKAGEFWCSKCEEFLCTKCFEAHQRYLKRESHDAKRVMDIRTGSAEDFLEDTRTGNLSCSNPTHKSQTVSIYCKKCCKPLCCICALLDSQHAPFCDIHSETRRRQEELGTIGQELKQKRSSFEATYAALQSEAARLEQAQREMRELIRQHVEQLVRLIRREEEELLGLVEAGQEQGRQELTQELQRVEGVLRRMEAGERLVEKMNLYATEQEVMDMQPFIKDSLQELQRLKPPVAGDQAQPRQFAECRARLQGLVERVMGQPGAPAPQHDSTSEDESTLILDLEPPGEHCQPHGHLHTGLSAHHQPCAPVSDPSGRQGGDMSPTQPTPPALVTQREEEAEKDLGSAHGDPVPLPRSIQDSLASLQEDFGGWARSNVQQADELLKISDRLLQAQHRANRHLVFMTREIRAMSRSLATVTSAVGPLLQPVANPRDTNTADVDWPSLPSDMLELFPLSTPQEHEPLVPAAGMALSPRRSSPATRPASPACSEPRSPASKGECPKSRHPTRGKRGGKPSTRLRKRTKKSLPRSSHGKLPPERGTFTKAVGVATAQESQRLHARNEDVVLGDPRAAETFWVVKVEDNNKGWNQMAPQQPSCLDQPGTSCSVSPIPLLKEDRLLEDVPDGNGGLHNSENESIQMTAVDGEKIFPVLIQPVKYLSSLMAKNSVYEVSLRNLLCHLHTVHKPILGGFGLWSFPFLTLLKALTVMNKKEEFSSVMYGFLDILPLMKEQIPKRDNRKLKNLANTYLWWHFGDGSAMENMSIVKYLCKVLDVDLVKKPRLILSQASQESFISLQPLLAAKLLTKYSAQTLGSHNIGLSELWSCYQYNPKKGLHEACHIINACRHSSEKRVRNLSKVKVYFQHQEELAFGQGLLQAPGAVG
ncbi:protein PML-like [Pluvialis apricaria]